MGFLVGTGEKRAASGGEGSVGGPDEIKKRDWPFTMR